MYLRELVERYEGVPVQNLSEEVKVLEMTRAFDAFVDFLRDQRTFPNKPINKLVTLMWKLVGNKRIPVVLDQWGFPSVCFAVLGNEKRPKPLIIIPQDFLQQVRESPESQIGIIAYMASQCRDAYANKITGKNSQEVNRRAQAYEAETFLTLKEMAAKEGITLRLIPFQEKILERFPHGLRDLPQELKYRTPPYPPNHKVGFKWN
ncbi:MAG TPA: hypothetical protein VMW04_01890 [Patescibacteria group bacterium]|nr:hypothetical protein [Patescibacteria group bacterium]